MKKRQQRLRGTDVDALLKRAIEQSGLNRFELSKRSGLSYSIVHGYVAGTKQLQLGSVAKILDGLGYVAELTPKRKG